MGRFTEIEIDDGRRYFFVQADPLVPFMQILVQLPPENGRRKEDGAFGQLAAEVDRENEGVLLIPFSGTRPPVKLRSLMYEGSEPPLVYRNGRALLTAPYEPCIYCGKDGLLGNYLNAFEIPSYSPKGKSCAECHRVIVTA